MATSTTTSKGASTLQASASNGAGSTSNSSSIDMTTKHEADIRGTVTNGATGPTVAATIKVQASTDNSTWKDTPFKCQPAGTGNAAVGDFLFKGLRAGQYYRVVCTGNTVQAVTWECFCDYISALSTA